jgi:hypothetical protein
MGEELTQDKRIATLTTPLGKDKLVLTTPIGVAACPLVADTHEQLPDLA